MKVVILSLLILLFASCTDTDHSNIEHNSTTTKFDSIPKSQVMVVGTYHFRQEENYDELSKENQIEIKKLVSKLAEFKPTKVVVEKLPENNSIYQDAYQKYLLDDTFINNHSNETAQLGFRLAKQMGHQKIYLFDNKPDFIGSLEGFTFERLGTEMSKDSLFANQHLDIIMDSFNENEKKLNSLSLYENIKERNSPTAQRWNAQRMHSYEIRTGIQDSWMGSDWLGRWYQRNIRMMANIMAFNNSGEDRILIIVGDNHKWVLDTLFGFNPDFEVISSYNILK